MPGTSRFGAAMKAASGAAGQLIDAAEVGLGGAGGAAGMDAPDLATVTDRATGGVYRIRPGAADQGDTARRQQALHRRFMRSRGGTQLHAPRAWSAGLHAGGRVP